MKHFIAFCRRNWLFAALLAAELAVVCALAAGLFGAPYKLALTPGDFTNTLPDIAAADDDGLKIWNQIGGQQRRKQQVAAAKGNKVFHPGLLHSLSAVPDRLSQRRPDDLLCRQYCFAFRCV